LISEQTTLLISITSLGLVHPPNPFPPALVIYCWCATVVACSSCDGMTVWYGVTSSVSGVHGCERRAVTAGDPAALAFEHQHQQPVQHRHGIIIRGHSIKHCHKLLLYDAPRYADVTD